MVATSKLKISIALIAVLTCVSTADASILSLQTNLDSSMVMDGTQTYDPVPIASSVTYLPNIAGTAHSIIFRTNTIQTPHNWFLQWWSCPSIVNSITALYATCSRPFGASGTTTTVFGDGYTVFSTSTNAWTFTVGSYWYFELQRSNDTGTGYMVQVYGTSATTTHTTFGLSNFYPSIVATTTPYFQIQTEEFNQGASANGTFDFPLPPNDSLSSNLTSAFSQWNILQTKFPLNWIFESYPILEALGTATATAPIADDSITFNTSHLLALGYAQPATSSRTFTFFASNTLANVASVPGWSSLRTLESYFLWIGLIWWVWSRKNKLVALHQPT